MTSSLRQEEDDELGEAAGMDDLPERRAEFLDRLGLTPPPLTDLLARAREAAAIYSAYVLLNEHGDAYRQDRSAPPGPRGDR
ncbi:hypothetical protein ABII15_36725 [Streptomyces sp. HUAS MG91]|uniref:Uncharacterized protein n=1 Tax=Streptomyces tabacisoli TaxID=3156398 RepID=A0AAU8J4N1_9ACTN